MVMYHQGLFCRGSPGRCSERCRSPGSACVVRGRRLRPADGCRRALAHRSAPAGVMRNRVARRAAAVLALAGTAVLAGLRSRSSGASRSPRSPPRGLRLRCGRSLRVGRRHQARAAFRRGIQPTVRRSGGSSCRDSACARSSSKGRRTATSPAGPGTTGSPPCPAPAARSRSRAIARRYLQPFRHLDRLRPGDSIVLELPYGTFQLRGLRPPDRGRPRLVDPPPSQLREARAHGLPPALLGGAADRRVRSARIEPKRAERRG